MSGDKPSLEEIKGHLETVLNYFGPQEMADGMHEHFSWLLGLVNDVLEDDNA